MPQRVPVTLRFVALWVFVALANAEYTHAQDSGHSAPRGLVLDESGAAVPGASVAVFSVSGTQLQARLTGTDGHFTLDPLPDGSYWLEATAPYFERHRAVLHLGPAAESPLRVVLHVARLEGEITVTAARGMAGDVDRAPPVVTVLDAESYRRRPLPTLGSALEGVTGVMVQRSAQGQASPFLRGLTGYQVVHLIDGVRFNNTVFRSGPNQYLAWIDSSQTARIEVVLGPASAQFGSDALGGAIQVITPTLGLGGAASWETRGGASVFASSADEAVGADATLFVRVPSVTAMIGGARRRAGDVRAGGDRDSHHVLRRLFGLGDEPIADLLGDRVRDTGFSQAGGHAKATARLGDSQHLTLWYQRSDQDRVRGSKDLWGGLGRLRSDFEPQRLQFLYGRYERFGLGRLDWLTGTVSVNSQADGSVRQNLRVSDPIVQDEVTVDALGYVVQAGTHLGDRQALVFGGEVYDEHVSARRDETTPSTGAVTQRRALYPNGSRYVTSGVFVQDEIEIVRGEGGPSLVARVGGRFTRVDVRTDADANRTASGASLGVVDSSSHYSDWTFNAGLTSQLTPLVGVHALVGRGFRAPNLNDLGALGLNDLGYEVPAESTIDAGAFVGTSDGEGALSTGTPVSRLGSERLLNYEVGVALNWSRLSARVHGFDAELADPIVRRSLVFPVDASPSTLAGVPVAPIPQTPAQRAQGVVGVATAFDPRAVKAFVNDGRARYSGLDARLRVRASARWSAEANYSFLVGHDLDPSRPVRRLPPQQGVLSVRHQPGKLVSWIEASASFSGPQERLSGGDLTDERIGAARRRSDINDFFQGGAIAPFIGPGADGLRGTADDVFTPTGETVAMIRDRVLPIGATINGVTVIDDSTRVPLYTRTDGFVSVNLGAGLSFGRRLDLTIALLNAFDRNYRVHGSGVDAPGRSVFATLRVSY